MDGTDPRGQYGLGVAQFPEERYMARAMLHLLDGAVAIRQKGHRLVIRQERGREARSGQTNT